MGGVQPRPHSSPVDDLNRDTFKQEFVQMPLTKDQASELQSKINRLVASELALQTAQLNHSSAETALNALLFALTAK